MKSMVKIADFGSLESDVLTTVVPSESILPRVNRFIASLEKTAKKLKLDCRIVIGGSVAKDTHLADDFDCDLFARFSPKKYADDEIAGELTKLVVAHADPKLDVQLLHGSRDYYKTIVNGITYELVPTLDVARATDAPNITDMSLFHVDWTVAQCKKAERKKKPLNNQIRLAKAFCKGQGVYGAESYIGGFSGHVLDILVVACGGFRQLLEQSLTWKEKEVIDVEKHYKTSALALSSLNEAKLTSPIIVIDPIVAQRNAASALSKKCFDMFKESAKKYLSAPSVAFFVHEKFNPKSLENESGKTYSISLVARSDKKDIAGAQYVKVLEYIVEQAALHDFVVVGSGWSWGTDTKQNGTLFIRVEKEELSATTTARGPPLRIPEAVVAFKKMHKTVVEKNGVLFATVPRKYTTFGSLLDAVLKHDLVTIRCKSFSRKKSKEK